MIIRFSCTCGVRLKARPDMAGRQGRCRECGETIVIPAVSDASPDNHEAEEASHKEAVAIEEICGVCQCVVEEDDDRQSCDACGSPFHTECWEENLGCSVYGCSNVNTLKEGPDIRIESTPAPTPRRPTTSTRNQDEGFPWEYVVLGVAALATPLGVLMCGFPTLLPIVGAALVYIVRGPSANLLVLLSGVLLSICGGLFGLFATYFFFFYTM